MILKYKSQYNIIFKKHGIYLINKNKDFYQFLINQKITEN